MKRFLKIAFVAIAMTVGLSAKAQPEGYDVFSPIGKYIMKSDADALSKWFADNLEISILTNTADASRAQARQIVKAFFENYSPRSFNITHTAGRANMKYALAFMNAGGEMFMVTIFACSKGGEGYRIQQFKIERAM